MKTKLFTTVTIIFSVSIFLSYFSVFGQTNVSGGIYTNTTWTLANSPYIVTDTVVVFPGVTLTIEPSVNVKFNDSTYLEIRQGTLHAIGNITDSITFSSNSNNPFSGIWNGIGIKNDGAVEISYCRISYAATALNLSSQFFIIPYINTPVKILRILKSIYEGCHPLYLVGMASLYGMDRDGIPPIFTGLLIMGCRKKIIQCY